MLGSDLEDEIQGKYEATMKTLNPSAMLLLSLMLLAGCIKNAASEKQNDISNPEVAVSKELELTDDPPRRPRQDAPTDVLKFEGLRVSISVPQNLETSIHSFDNGDEVLKFGSHSLKLSDGKVYFDDKEYGTVNAGQTITISADRILSIGNTTARKDP